MKKKRRFSFMMVLVLILSLTLGVVPASAHPDDMEGPPAKYKIVGKDGTIQGKLSQTTPVLYYQFTIKGTNQVELSKDISSPATVKTRVFDSKGKIVDMRDLRTEPREGYTKNRCYYYLIGGTYYLEVTSSEGSYGKFSLHMNATPVFDTYTETPKKYNDFPECADPVIMNRPYFGTICSDEPGRDVNKGYVDCYTFNVYYDNCPIQFLFSTNMINVAFAVYPTKEGVTIPDNTNSLGIGDYTYSGQVSQRYRYTLDRGEYEFVVWTIGAFGEYFFLFNEQQDTETVELAPMYLAPDGRKSAFNSKEMYQLGNPIVSWEVADVQGGKVAHVDPSERIFADKPGMTVVTGRGYRTKDNAAVRYQRDVIVEYTDVVHASTPSKNPYYYDAVYWATNEGIAAGYADKNGVYQTFGPQKECTRAQIVTFLWRLAGCPEPRSVGNTIGSSCYDHTLIVAGTRTYGNGGASGTVSFSDVKDPSAYYYKAVHWAAENGITGGYSDGTFRPQNVCTRAQIVTFLWRMAGCPEPYQSGNVSHPIGSSSGSGLSVGSGFSDNTDTSAYYYKAVLWASSNGITGGYSDGTFRPLNQCSRAQCVTFLYRFEEKFGPKG